MASIYQPEQEEKNKDQQESTLTGGAAGGSNVQKTTASPAAPKPQGSGRFTNIQKYLQANKQGGQQLAQGVGQNIQSGISKQKEQSQDYLSNIRQGIESAKGVAQKGGQYLQQLKGIGENIQQATGAEQAVTRPQDLGIQQFTKQPGFQQFQDIQAGRGVDEALLGSQQADLSRAAGQYLSESQQAAQKLGTGGGRFDLLRQTFGGDVNPQYTTGQQRLDQLFLARQGLQPLQEDVRQNIKSARELSRQASQTGADVGRLIGQERQLMGDIGAQAKSNEQAYLDMLSSYVPEINRLRDQQYAQAEQAFKGAAGTSGASLSDEQLANLGLSRGQKIYDVLDDLSFQDVTQKGQRATGYQDIASEADVNRYQALARMAGITPESQALTSASDLGAAYVGKEGEQSLASRLSVVMVAARPSGLSTWLAASLNKALLHICSSV